jgi:hypothetical protein
MSLLNKIFQLASQKPVFGAQKYQGYSIFKILHFIFPFGV